MREKLPRLRDSRSQGLVSSRRRVDLQIEPKRTQMVGFSASFRPSSSLHVSCASHLRCCRRCWGGRWSRRWHDRHPCTLCRTLSDKQSHILTVECRLCWGGRSRKTWYQQHHVSPDTSTSLNLICLRRSPSTRCSGIPGSRSARQVISPSHRPLQAWHLYWLSYRRRTCECYLHLVLSYCRWASTCQLRRT